MRKLCYPLLLLLFSLKGWGQPREITLKGYLGVEGGESFTYMMVFTDSAGLINGYSRTWLEEGKDVKALISGTIDRKNNRLSFREERILYNHGFSSRTTICLIQATLQYTITDGGITLLGPISSSDAGNVYCSRGSINITGQDVILELFAKPPQKDSLVTTTPVPPPAAVARKSMKIVYDTVQAPSVQNTVTPPKQTDKITSGVEKVYEWNSDKILIDIWDGGQVDGDMITVTCDDKPLLSRYTLTKEKKQISIPLTDNDIRTIVITANNEGNDPPNTANLVLTDDDVRHSVIAYNKIGKQAVIRIKRIAK